MPEPLNLDEARAHAANYRGELSRLGMVTPMLIEALIAEIEWRRKLLDGRDDFIGSKGLWEEFVSRLDTN